MTTLPKPKHIRITIYQVCFSKKTMQEFGWEKHTELKFEFPSTHGEPVIVEEAPGGYPIKCGSKEALFYINAKDMVNRFTHHFDGQHKLYIMKDKNRIIITDKF